MVDRHGRRDATTLPSGCTSRSVISVRDTHSRAGFFEPVRPILGKHQDSSRGEQAGRPHELASTERPPPKSVATLVGVTPNITTVTLDELQAAYNKTVAPFVASCLGDGRAVLFDRFPGKSFPSPCVPVRDDQQQWARGPMGTGFDWRMRALVTMDPLPTKVPDPPPWHPRHLCGMPVDSLSHQLRTPLRSCREPLDPDLLADLDKMTEIAIDRLLGEFRGVPKERRRGDRRVTKTMVGPRWRGRGFGLREPDLIFGETLVELKSSAEPLDPVEYQLAALVLQDHRDRLGIREVAAYWARYGALVRCSVFELLPAAQDLAGLQRLRRRHRKLLLEIAALADRAGGEQRGGASPA